MDEALLELWSAGFGSLAGPSDYVTGKDLKAAKQALGIPTRREAISPRYWRTKLGLEEHDFHTLLRNLAIPVRPGAATLPKGAVVKLKAQLRQIEPNQASERRDVGKVDECELPPQLSWRLIGHERALRILTYDEVVGVHNSLVRDFANHDDPIEPPGVRSEVLLQSAVTRPRTSLGSKQKYPTAEMAAAALIHSLVHNHPFHNGNKRTALVAMLVFLDKNGLLLTCAEDDLFQFVLQIANHRITDPHPKDLADREVQAMAHWIHKNCRNVEKGERPIPFRRLRQILDDWNCTFEFAPGTGNRINISRIVEQPKGILFRRPREVTLTTQVFYGDEGREVDRSCISKIRADLHLDESHSVDSKTFYENAPGSAEGFIADYRKTLDRLARL